MFDVHFSTTTLISLSGSVTVIMYNLYVNYKSREIRKLSDEFFAMPLSTPVQDHIDASEKLNKLTTRQTQRVIALFGFLSLNILYAVFVEYGLLTKLLLFLK